MLYPFKSIKANISSETRDMVCHEHIFFFLSLILMIVKNKNKKHAGSLFVT